MELIIGLDFDGTVVKHEFPQIGAEVPFCIDVLKKLIASGGKIVLNTMRSGQFLTDAVNFLKERGIKLYGINKNPTQKAWTTSPKVYANLYIDDAALGCPLIQDSENERPYVDWLAVDAYIASMQPIFISSHKPIIEDETIPA